MTKSEECQDIKNLKENSPPFYTFSFKRYEQEKIEIQKQRYFNKIKFRLKSIGAIGGICFVVGNILPLMMYLEFDINLYKPRVSEYLANRLSWWCLLII